jgi:hypothetical protein
MKQITDLTNYFEFEGLLTSLSQQIEGHELESFYRNKKANGNPAKPFPSDIEDVNHTLLNNKDGKFSWRPFQLIHPFLYVAIVHKITNEQNWNLIKSRFEVFSNNNRIQCHSLPKISETALSDKATSIINWWETIEQKSLQLALEYEYIMHTDISDCYGSIYTHSIPWALHTKPFAKENKGPSHIGNVIDKYIRNMTYGQTNGIPQGSVLMDFIAEMILGYADLELSNKISEANIDDYEIHRYRDDYRIFTNNPQDAHQITKLLTEILIGLGMKLNAQKTIASNNVIKDSIKPDKLFWNSMKQGAKSLQGHLLLIHKLSEEYPNSGSLTKALDKFYNRIKSSESILDDKTVLISILVDISYKNPRTYPIVCAILSKLLSFFEENEQNDILSLIKSKFNKIPNTGHLKLWLQRITLKIDRNIEYSEALCKRLNNGDIKIWNSDWLTHDIERIINEAEIINETKISETDTIIQSEEVQLFEY